MSRTKTALPVALCLVIMATAARAGDLTSTFNFLRSDVGARASALAGAFFSVTDDPTVVFYNPGALPTLTSPRGSAGFFKELLDVNSGHLAFGMELEGIGTVAAGLVFTHYGEFVETDASGNTTGSFGASDIALTLGYGLLLEEGFSLGGAVKVVHSSIAGYSSTGLAVDAGVLYRIPDSRIALAMSIRNVGTQLDSYLGATEELPLDLGLGVSVVPKGLPLLLNAGVHRLTDDAEIFAERFRAFMIGGEFTLSKVFQLRVGYDNARRRDLKVGTSAGLAGFSAGLGIRVRSYRLDYGLNSLGAIGNLHRITLNAEW
jgi:hypothetical protein